MSFADLHHQDYCDRHSSSRNQPNVESGEVLR